MKRCRRLSFWFLLAAFAGACVWWTLWVPFSPRRLYSAIPRTADFVSVHTEPAGRWQAMLANPLLRRILLEKTEAKSEELDAAAADKELAGLVNQLAGRELVIAHVPRLGDYGFDAWVAASWVKHGGKIMEWAAAGGRIPDLTPLDLGNGHDAWMLRVHEDPALPMVGLAISHGVLMACYSRDPLALRALVERVDFGAEPHGALARLNSLKHAGPDRAWLAWRTGGSVKVYETAVSLSQFDAEGITAHVTAPWPTVPPIPKTELAAQWQYLDHVFGNTPSAVVSLPAAMLEDAVRAWVPGPELQRPFTQFLDSITRTNAPAFLAIMSGDNAGRLLSLRIPAVIIGMKLREGIDADARVNALMDDCNRLTRWKLIPRTLRFNEDNYVVIDSAGGSMYSRIGPQEKPAFLVHEGWLLLGSGLEPLQRLRERSLKPGAKGLTALPPALRRSRAAVAADVSQLSGSALRTLAVVELILSFVDGAQRRQLQPAFAAARTQLEWGEYVGPTQAWLDPEEPVFHVRIGAAP